MRSGLHRAISKEVLESNQALRKEDNSYTIGSKEKLELLLPTHFPLSTLQTDWNTPVTAQSRPCATDWAKSKSIVTTERLRWAIGKFQPYKSPGPDGIQPILLQRALSQLPAPIRKILISSLALGHIPTAWSIAEVVFKLERKTSETSFRPFSLTSFLLKTLEKHSACGASAPTDAACLQGGQIN